MRMLAVSIALMSGQGPDDGQEDCRASRAAKDAAAPEALGGVKEHA
jgi:hypothetical protein